MPLYVRWRTLSFISLQIGAALHGSFGPDDQQDWHG